MLVLLIIFMVTAPLIQQGVKVNLPADQGRAGRGAARRSWCSPSTRASGCSSARRRCRWTELEEKLKANAKAQADKEVYLHADRALPYGTVVEVMAAAQRAGITNLGMITDPLAPQTSHRRWHRVSPGPCRRPGHPPGHRPARWRGGPRPSCGRSCSGRRWATSCSWWSCWGSRLRSRAPHIDLDQKPIHATPGAPGQARDAKLLPRKEEPPPPPRRSRPAPPPAPPPPDAPKPVAVPGLKPAAAPAARAEPTRGVDDGSRRTRLFDAFARPQEGPRRPAGRRGGRQTPRATPPPRRATAYFGLLDVRVHRYFDVPDGHPRGRAAAAQDAGVR